MLYEEADAILWRSDERINLRATGTYATASLRFFQDVTRGPKKAENLSEKEDHWIKSAHMGGLVWAEPYEGIATELDFNEYPNILAHSIAFWPIGPGEFRTFSRHPVDHKCTRTFRYNYDLQLAKNLGLHIELSSE
ncbi:14724_t:CDS:2, partial [Gigaspora margarita]